MIYKIPLTSLVLASLTFAQGISISLPSTESVNEKIEILRQIGKKSGMEEAQRERYDMLWEQANQVAKMNSRCASISLNDVLDQDCQHFYEVDLPKFDKEFFELTGDFRLNSVKAVQSLDDKKALISACVDALDPNSYNLSQMMRLSGEISPEPLDDGLSMVKYKLAMDMDETNKGAIAEQFAKWYESCKPGIVSQDEFAPYFLQKMSKTTGGKNGNFTISDNALKYVLNRENTFSYYINNRFIFAQAYHKDQILFSMSSSGEINFAEMPLMNWKNNLVLSEKEVKEKGVSGKLLWGKRLAPQKHPVNLNNRVVKTVEIAGREWTMDMGITNWQKAQSACPAGWRLPSDQDWIDMGTLVKENSYGYSIGASLKNARGWQEQGFDFFGFSARPQAYTFSETANCSGNCAKYWSATETDGHSASGWVLMGETLKLVPHKKSESLSVRCVRGGNNDILTAGNATSGNIASGNSPQGEGASANVSSGQESSSSGTAFLIASLAIGAVALVIFTGKD